MMPFAADGSTGARDRAVWHRRARMMAARNSAAGRPPGHGSWCAPKIAATVMCLLLIVKVSDAAAMSGAGWAGQVPWVVALFVLPLLYTLPGPRGFLARYRWPVLGAQAVLTWVPFAIFGGNWVIGIGGLLAGLVLLMVPGRVSWLVAGLLLAADVALRAAVIPLPSAPAWAGDPFGVLFFVDDALTFFGMVRLAQIVGEVEDARGQAAGLAVAHERLQAAEALQAAVGTRLADIAEKAAAARCALSRDAGRARAQIAAAGVTAREAVAQARAVAAHGSVPPGPEPGATPAGGAVIGARLAWAVLVVELSAYTAAGVINILLEHDGPWLAAPVVAGDALLVALQLYHSRGAARGARPRAWPVTLGLQAVLAYGFFLPFLAGDVSALAAFLPGSVLLLVPGRWRWAGYAAVIASFSALYATVPLHGLTAADQDAAWALNQAAELAIIGLVVYGLSRLAGLARELDGLRGQLARVAAVQERLRVARDVHDLLGLGLSAVALKADLAGALIGRDDGRAEAEMQEMGRICAAAEADVRVVAGVGARLCLAEELAAAERILASAGIKVRTSVPGEPLPAAADRVLAPVLREAVTNVLRHAAATVCTVKVTAVDEWLRLDVGNDGVTGRPAACPAGGGGGRGLANLQARVQAWGGRLAARRAGGWYGLTAQIPVDRARAGLAEPWRALVPARDEAGQPGVDDVPAPGHRADGGDEVAGRPVLEQVARHAGA